MDIPETRYADSGGVSIAYQVIGDGPIDLLVAPGFISHLDMFWSFPSVPRFYEQLTSFARVILFDKRGTGVSDPVANVPTLEERIDDIRAVLDAAGSEQAALFGISEGGPMSVLFAATYPERVTALILYGSIVWGGHPEFEEHWAEIRALTQQWGQGHSGTFFSPSISGNAVLRRLIAVFERAAASPAMARALIDSCVEIDVRAILPSIQVPTVVIHRKDERVVPLSQSEALAAGIPGAKLVVIPGIDHNPWSGDHADITGAIAQFLTGRVAERRPDRILTTLLFTDIVGSTERASELQDAAWREVLDAHNTTVRDALAEYRGREVNTTGDGFLATFDGPARAIECAGAIRDALKTLGIDVRAGVHTGEVELLDQDVAGVAVHLAARVCAAAGPGDIVVTSTVKDLVTGAGIDFVDRGSPELKGVPGQWQLFAVASDGDAPAVTDPTQATAHLSRFDRAAIRIAKRAPATSRLLARAVGAPR
jgi:class 3 adenylate cyclase/pimeloyl-ACP methyl ester carboxylesterase